MVTENPQEEFKSILSFIAGGVKPKIYENWRCLLNKVGIQERYTNCYELGVLSQIKDTKVSDIIKTIFTLLKLYITNPYYREFIIMISMELPSFCKVVSNNLGYGIYIGEKLLNKTEQK